MAERFEIDQTITIFQGDNEFTSSLNSAGKSLSVTQYEELSEILIDNNIHISANTVSSLLGENYLNAEFDSIFGGDSVGLYRQTFYTYKYAAVKLFFRQNYKKFLPEFDATQLESKEKSKLFVKAFMREFDRFSLIIDNIYNIVDIDKIPADYLDYLAQLIGYEREDFYLINDISFRELLKNMIEIYQIKGSNYSFELFFNFLGFDITLNEFWFDKRYGDSNINTNLYTSSTDKNTYLFYLTPYKPTTVIPSNMSEEYLVTEDQIKTTMDLNMFDQYISWHNNGDTRGYTAKQLIGDSTGCGDTYTYFKSNVIQYSLATLGTEQESELTEEDQTIINLYVKFLTPIFINARLLLAATPYSDEETSIYLKDFDRLDPVYVGTESSNHTWEFNVVSVDVDIGDTFTLRSSVSVSDPDSILYNNIKWYDVFYLSGDTNGDTIAGKWPVYGDTRGNSITGYDVYGGDTTYKSHTGDTTVIYIPYKLTSAIGDTNLVDRGDSGGFLRIGGPDTMLHLYEGKYPAKYHWGDTELGDAALMNYADNEPELFELSTHLYSSKESYPAGDSIITINFSDEEYKIGDSTVTYNNPWNKWTNHDSFGIFKGTTNVILSPENLTTTNWVAETNASVSLSNHYFNNHRLTKVTTGSTTGKGVKSGDSFEFVGTNDIKSFHFVVKNEDATTDTVVYLYDHTTLLYKINITIDWIAKSASASAGTIQKQTWHADDLIEVWATTPTITITNKHLIYLRPSSGDVNKSCYFTEIQAEDSRYPTPYISGTRIDGQLKFDNLRLTRQGTIECWVRPWFEAGISHGTTVFSWQTDVDNRLQLYYNSAGNRWTAVWKQGTTSRYLYGTTVYVDATLKTWIHLKLAWDFEKDLAALIVNGDTKDSAWSDTIDTFDYSIETLYIGSRYLVGYDDWHFDGLITDFMFKPIFDISSTHYDGDTYYIESDYYVRQPHGGHFIGGYHNDTRSVIYDPNDSTSAYYKIAAANPTWVEEQILDYIRQLIQQGDTGLYDYYKGSTYNVRSRDFLLPIDAIRNQPPGDSLSGDSWIRYRSINEGDSTGDSVWHYTGGFVNPTIYKEDNHAETGSITMGMNLPLEVDAVGRLGENQNFNKNRDDYYLINYSPISGDFLDGEVITGDSSGAKLRVLTSKSGDSYFVALTKQGSFYVGELIEGDSSGDSATLTSITKQTDDYGLVQSTDVVNGVGVGEISVYDPGNGDTYRYEFHPLTADDYITLHDSGDTSNGTYRVASTSHTGDTTTITLGDSLPGTDQTSSGGYVYSSQIGFIKSIDKINANGVGQVVVYDTNRRFAFLTTGDTIKIKDRGDTNEGVYTVGDSIVHVRTGAADVDGTTTFELGDSLPGADGDSNGMLEIYSNPWTLGKYTYSQHDYLKLTKI